MIVHASEVACTAVALTFAALVARIGIAWLAIDRPFATDPMAPVPPLARARRATAMAGGSGDSLHHERQFEPAEIE